MGLYSLTEIGEETILLSYRMVYDYRLVVSYHILLVSHILSSYTSISRTRGSITKEASHDLLCNLIHVPCFL